MSLNRIPTRIPETDFCLWWESTNCPPRHCYGPLSRSTSLNVAPWSAAMTPLNFQVKLKLLSLEQRAFSGCLPTIPRDWPSLASSPPVGPALWHSCLPLHLPSFQAHHCITSFHTLPTCSISVHSWKFPGISIKFRKEFWIPKKVTSFSVC